MSESTYHDVVKDSLVLKTPLPLAEHPASVYLSGLSPGSGPAMRQALDKIAALLTNGCCDALTLDWAALRYKHTAAVRSILMSNYAPATANKMLSALRRVLKEALRLELMDAADFARAVDISNVKVSSMLQGRALTEAEITSLMQVCFDDPTPTGYRDAALIAILRGSGLRRAEVVNADLSDFNSTNGAILVRSGKGGKNRTVYLPDGAIEVVSDWRAVRGEDSGPLLCHINKAGCVVLRRLTPQAVMYILQKRGSEAGVESFSPHDFRRTFISELLDSGADISTVQRLAGHATPDLTARYDRRNEETKRRAVQKLNIPLNRRKK